MNGSLKFKFIEESLQSMLELISSNQNIKRYLKHLTNNPLASSLPDIEGNLMDENIYLTPFDETILEEIKVMMFLYPHDGRFITPKSKHIYCCDIICPIGYWVLLGTGKFRPTRIADEICMMIDQKNVAGIGDVEINNYKIGKVSKAYGFLTLFIEVTTASIKGNR